MSGSGYLLVHGGHHTKRCWDRLAARLEALGDRVIAIDLPGRGRTAANLKTATLDDWVNAIDDAVERFDTPPVLVGHSMGGVSTSQYAARRAAGIAGIAYVSAVVPADGSSGMQTLFAAGGESALLGDGVFSLSEDRTTATIDPEAAVRAFYDRCSSEVVEEALAQLCPEPVVPLATPLRLGTQFLAVPKVYIGALGDQAVPPRLQRSLAERAEATFETIDADHSPFFSAIPQLAAQLHAVGQRFRGTRSRRNRTG